MPYLMHSRAHLKGVGCGVAIEPVASWKRCRASFGGYAWSGCQSQHIHTYTYIHRDTHHIRISQVSSFFPSKKATGPTVDPFFGRPRQGDFAADGLALGGAAGAASLRVGGAQGAAPRAALRGTTRQLGDG